MNKLRFTFIIISVFTLSFSMSFIMEKAIDKASQSVQSLADQYAEAWKTGTSLPAISNIKPDITMEQAYDLQKAWVFQTMDMEEIGGVKGGVVTPGSQETFGIEEPICGVLRGAGTIDGSEAVTLSLSDYVGLELETEIGFIVGKKIDRKFASIDEFKEHVSAIVPVIELVSGTWDQPEGKPKAVDYIAINLKARGIIVGNQVDPSSINPDDIQLRFSRGKKVLHEAKGSDNWQGLFETGLFMAQFAQRQGITLQPGQVIICGALGQVHPAKKGKYKYESEALGDIEFRIVK